MIMRKVKKQWIDKKGRLWEWEETSELREFIKNYGKKET